MTSFPNGLKNYFLKIRSSPLLSANKFKKKLKRVKSVNALREKQWDDRFIYEKIPLYDSKNDKNVLINLGDKCNSGNRKYANFKGLHFQDNSLYLYRQLSNKTTMNHLFLKNKNAIKLGSAKSKDINFRNDNLANKSNTTLQEKLKKIFMNRDKVKFQYAKQDIPDNLKYHSDESETSENEELRKSKASKKKTPIISSSKKDKDIVYSKQRESNKNSNKKKVSELKLSNSRNENKKIDLEEKNPSEFNNDENIKSITKDENMKYNISNQKRKISYNNEDIRTK